MELITFRLVFLVFLIRKPLLCFAKFLKPFSDCGYVQESFFEDGGIVGVEIGYAKLLLLVQVFFVS
jgi:hypothetical protein